MSKQTLGLAMLTHNEASHIPATISQFYLIVDDIVVVDGGSSDGTCEWVERMGSRLFHRPFRHDFSDQRNFAIEQLKTDWVYVHDPDERLEPPLVELIPSLLDDQEGLMERGIIAESKEKYDCFGIPRKNFIDGICTASYPDYQYRLFRNYCRFTKPVHEELINFKNKTVIDFTRTNMGNNSRFNIMQYKSSSREADLLMYYAQISRGDYTDVS